MAQKKAFRGKLDYSNPWYSSSQESWLETGPARHHNKKRVSYLLSAIERLCPKNPKILDAGCGDGVLTKYFVRIPGARVVGVDYNPLRLKRARKNVPNAAFKAGDLLDLPFKSNSFDVVVAHHVLEHIKDEVTVLRELSRVVKRKGIIIIGVPNEGSFIAKIRDRVVQRKILETTDHVNFYDVTSLRRKIEGVRGLKVAETKAVGGILVPHHGAHMIMIKFRPFYELLHALAQISPEFADSLFVVARKE